MPRTKATPKRYGRYHPYYRAGAYAAGKFVRYAGNAARAYTAGKARKVMRSITGGTRGRSDTARRYNTTGFRVKRFRRSRKPRVDPYLKYGSVQKYENGGTQSDANCVYVGHVAGEQQNSLKAAFRAVTRDLMKMYGQDFVSWEEIFKTGALELQISYTYYVGTATTSTQVNLPVGAQPTFEALANQIYNDITTRFSNLDHRMENIWINEVTGALQTHALIRLKDYKLHFECSSLMTIQNRTLAGTSTVDENDENINEISNNPICGRQYVGNYNGFYPKSRDTTEGSYEGYIGAAGTGIISTAAASSLIQETRKPPPGTYFRNCMKTSRVIITPGVIKKSFISFKKTLYFNQFIKIMNNVIETPTGTQEVLWGKCAMFGLEKVLNSRQSENNVAVGFEVNHVFKCRGYYEKNCVQTPLLFIV